MPAEPERAVDTNDGPFREPLPASCPPPDATEIVSETIVFRLVASIPPSEDSFQSQRAMKPHALFRVDECMARGLSVWADAEGASNARKLPALKRKGLSVCCVRLGAGAGFIKQTSGPMHRTWWPYRAYDILSRCEVMS